MGFSLIASTVVIGIAIAMAFQIFATDLFPTVSTINDAYNHLNTRLDTQAHTSLTITTINRTANVTTYDYTITIHNTGATTLPTRTMTILVNGITTPFTTTTPYLYPDTTTTLTLTDIPGADGKRVKIITENAIASYATYTP
jgi:archaellum component FlaF (FlaF/FlaG flagellin family)